MPAANQYQSGAHPIFSYSCSGSKIFRHNLSFPQGPGSVYEFQLRNITGDAYVTTAAANTVTVTSSATSGTFELVPLCQVGDYA